MKTRAALIALRLRRAVASVYAAGLFRCKAIAASIGAAGIIRLRLLLIWPLCLLASSYAALRMLYAIAANPRRAWVMAIAHDQLANAAANGDPDETISSRANRGRSERQKKWGCRLCRVLDWIDKDHCRNSAGV